VTSILEKSGHIVNTVSNGKELLEELKKHHFDIILTDIEMPDIDGLEATRIIRSSTEAGFDPKIPIIALTAHAFEENENRCLSAGMNDYVIKPFKKKDILQAINRQVSTYNIQATEATAASFHADKIINVPEALERLGGDEELLREIWTIFITDCPRNMELLKQALETRNHNMSERQAHTLKSTAGNIGADRLKDTALQIELASREKRADKAWVMYEPLEREAESVINALHELMSTSTSKT
jgi:CheY-like chemotaxis protein/HPt (histidine-containing phosphotransfer) domain-containing protein